LPRGGKSPTYRQQTLFSEDDALPLILDGNELGTISVNELFMKLK
jgi:hypothetical protein